MGTFIDLSGKRYGRLVVVERAYKKYDKIFWKCKCDCGKEVCVAGSQLKSGMTKSCGCIKHDYMVNYNTTHNSSKSRLYNIWCGIKQRCYYPKHSRYDLYGEKGIKVCDEWLDFENFRRWSYENGYNDSLTIDRIDNNKDYSPDNCRWVDNFIQANNTSRNIFYTYKGETKTLAQWSRVVGISCSVLYARIHKLKWDITRTLETPVRKMKVN